MYKGQTTAFQMNVVDLFAHVLISLQKIAKARFDVLANRVLLLKFRLKIEQENFIVPTSSHSFNRILPLFHSCELHTLRDILLLRFH
jgi:hypothetical protein